MNDNDPKLPLPLTPSALLPLLRFQPPAAVLIKGTVTHLFEPPKQPDVRYGRLSNDGASVRFRVDRTTPIANGDQCLIYGSLSIKHINPNHDYRATIEVQIDGTIVQVASPSLESVPEKTSAPELHHARVRVPLSRYLKDHNLSSMLIAVSPKAKGDILSAIGETTLTLRFADLSFATPAAFIAELQAQSWHGITGLVVARGGGSGLETVWDSPHVVKAILDLNIPFYTALGHSHDVTLADKYAHQAFALPAAFGTELISILKDLKTSGDATREIQRKLYYAEQETTRLRVELNQRNEQLKSTPTNAQTIVRKTSFKKKALLVLGWIATVAAIVILLRYSIIH